MYSHFTFADARRIQKVLSIMKRLSVNDDFFKSALAEFEAAHEQEKIFMCEYLLEIYNDAKDCEFMTLEQAVILASYPA